MPDCSKISILGRSIKHVTLVDYLTQRGLVLPCEATAFNLKCTWISADGRSQGGDLGGWCMSSKHYETLVRLPNTRRAHSQHRKSHRSSFWGCSGHYSSQRGFRVEWEVQELIRMCRIEGRCDAFAKNRHPKRSRHGRSKNQSEATIRDIKQSNQ